MQWIVQALVATTVLYSEFAYAALVEREPLPILQTRVEVESGLAKRFPTESYGYGFVGCFDELTGPLTLLNHPVTWDKKSVSSCATACFNAGPIEGPFSTHYLFAAVVNGTQCICDNAISSHAVQIDQGYCNVRCTAGNNEYCGGVSQYQVYFLSDTGLNPLKTNPVAPTDVGVGNGHYTYVGCYNDSAAARQLSGATAYTGPEMVPNLCAHICWAHGYVYSGVEFGRECYCGNTIVNAASKTAETDCYQVCAHDTTQVCGGPNKLGIWHATNPPRSLS